MIYLTCTTCLDWSRREDIRARTVKGRLSWTGRRYQAGKVRGRPNWFGSLLQEVHGTSSWFISWMLEQHEDQAHSTSAVIECRSDHQRCTIYLAERPAEGPAGKSARTEELLQREVLGPLPPVDKLTSSLLIPDFSSHRRLVFVLHNWFQTSTVNLLLRTFLQPLAKITAAGLNWPPPDYEQLTQLWTSPLLIQLPSK
ncbi:hypothetical protein F511_09491 [Dorcoceras hygrometricum]|uniref:Uncharacterized protein n=1 Tax=Dorcoceras hygrometricum TaxID=472368 RepID=A0A2Z7BX84_9LAMI|nr:hypothetical protein F511_09491 [Dorcoceras hygrometricum]